MRVMNIPSFRKKFENPDLENLFEARLSEPTPLFPEQAIPLVCYMAWPNDPAARDEALPILWSSAEGSETLPPRLGRIQHEWLRVADIFHTYGDLIDGQHQERRGGPSIGKAITLVEANAKSRGTGAATLWLVWERYKDVAPLVTAATLICGEARTRACTESFGSFGLSVDQFDPFRMAMWMPDLVLAVALEFERRGLSRVPHAWGETVLDHRTLWCIPHHINVAPLTPPARRIRSGDRVILSARRAGNRGRANKRETTPVSGESSGIVASA
jgi:hypothetical protein